MRLRKTSLFFCTICLICSCSISYAATVVTSKGIASAQNENEENNLEKLRTRALRNAADLAIMQVTGVSVSGERDSSRRSREETFIQGDDVTNKVGISNRDSSKAISRTEGHAKLIEILNEWQEKGQYYVRAKFSVETEEEAIAKRDAGYFWQRAGSPGIGISFQILYNNSVETGDSRTLRFFRDNLVRNSIEVSQKSDPQFLIYLNEVINSKELVDYGTITVNCQLTYKIKHVESGAVLHEYRNANGPKAGFDLQQGTEACISEIAPETSKDLIRQLAKIMSDRINNGVEYVLIIRGLPGNIVTRTTEISQNLYRVTSSRQPEYSNKSFTRKLSFKGSGADLALAFTEALADEDWSVSVISINKGVVELQWDDTSIKF